MPEARPFRLAHLSDPHLGPILRPKFRELVNKRALGFTNYGGRRQHRHDMLVLAALVADLKAQNVDHIAVTGDLVNLGLESEYESALMFLQTLGGPADVSLVPGNHDAYLRATANRPGRIWGAYMQGDDAPLPAKDDSAGFPYVRRRGPLGIVGVSSAVPTWLLSAAGRVGAEQAGRTGEALARLGADGACRVVLVHHPITRGGASPLRRLVDARGFREVLAISGAELVLHGHNHRPTRALVPGKEGAIPVIGVPSASMGIPSPEPNAAYNIYEISGEPGAWRCRVTMRGLTETGFAEQQRAELFGAQGQTA